MNAVLLAFSAHSIIICTTNALKIDNILRKMNNKLFASVTFVVSPTHSVSTLFRVPS